MGATSTVTIEPRSGKDGQLVYRVRVRPRGSPPQTATFTRLSDARKWAQVTEGAAIEGRHFPTAEAKRHTLSALLERYIRDVLPHKRTSPEDSRERTLRWWQAQLGYCLLVPTFKGSRLVRRFYVLSATVYQVWSRPSASQNIR